jgi:zinc transport system substrate-binding protein
LKNVIKTRRKNRFFAVRYQVALQTLFLVLLLFSGCEPDRAKNTDRITIATSIFPLYDIVTHIAGEYATVLHVIPVGANPHHYEPLPETVTKLQQATLFIGIQNEFDGWITDLLPKETRAAFVLQEEPAHENTNPHIWLSPRGGQHIAAIASRLLCEIDPPNRDQYEQNLISYARELTALDSTIANLFDRAENRTFIQWHPAWDYLARDYQLNIQATIEHGHGDEPSVKEFKQLIDEARSQGVRVVVVGLNVESKAAEALTNEIDGVLLRLDTIGDPRSESRSTYRGLMYENARLLSEALNPEKHRSAPSP